MTKEQSTEKFIVYELCYPDGEPFYVGKGRPSRPHMHIWSARRNEDSHKARVIRKIERQGGAVVVEIVLESDDHELVVAEEIRRIARYRHAGIGLTNKTNGGEGNVGWTPSDETRRKISQSLRGRPGRPHSPEMRVKMSDRQRGRKRPPFSEEWRARIGAAGKGRLASDATRAKMSASMKGQKKPAMTDPHRSKISAALKGRVFTDDHRAKIGEANRRRVTTEDTRAKMRASRMAFLERQRQGLTTNNEPLTSEVA